MIREAIMKIVDKQDLTYEEAFTVMNDHTERRLPGSTDHQEHPRGDDRGDHRLRRGHAGACDPGEDRHGYDGNCGNRRR